MEHDKEKQAPYHLDAAEIRFLELDPAVRGVTFIRHGGIAPPNLHGIGGKPPEVEYDAVSQSISRSQQGNQHKDPP